MQAEHAVAFGLGFVEPLIAGTLMGKFGEGGSVAFHVGRLVAQENRLDVDEHAVLARAIDFGVANTADGAAPGLAAERADVVVGKLDGNIQIDADLAQGIAQVFVSVVWVAAGIEHHDVTAAAEHHVVEARFSKWPPSER